MKLNLMKFNMKFTEFTEFIQLNFNEIKFNEI